MVKKLMLASYIGRETAVQMGQFATRESRVLAQLHLIFSRINGLVQCI